MDLFFSHGDSYIQSGWVKRVIVLHWTKQLFCWNQLSRCLCALSLENGNVQFLNTRWWTKSRRHHKKPVYLTGNVGLSPTWALTDVFFFRVLSDILRALMMFWSPTCGFSTNVYKEFILNSELQQVGGHNLWYIWNSDTLMATTETGEILHNMCMIKKWL